MREALIAALQAEAESGKPQEVKDAGHLLFGLRQMVRLFKHLAEDKAALHDMIATAVDAKLERAKRERTTATD